ncbi:F0F1 ATP synthase subunit gamma [Raineyella sp. W15-4]|uniref:F0F1 ATP synthase subunit gamma n=1 Tax=Raineyella sp. W15-4 TaxID=3081651 RepID=UPI0029533017|nr:F0F1 ATP synthase subunit gamma [Raineyella sp. W15-4]WOQ15515.1 F0F1 ATP synthase subunit gamma [Raineyella sp. W15-4]
MATLRELRDRTRSVQTTKKITRAMELIAAARIRKAQQAAEAADPYTRELTRAIQAVASRPDLDHPLLTELEHPKRSAVLLVTSDRGLAGGYSTNVLKAGESVRHYLTVKHHREMETYISGKKGVGFYEFRGREIKQSWEGFSDAPSYRDADAIARVLLEAFLTPTEEGGVDEIFLVYTRFVSRVRQVPQIIRLLPLEVVSEEEAAERAESGARMTELHHAPVYQEDRVETPFDFEPSPEGVLDELLPLYIGNRVYHALMQASASELAARQAAMKSATDNANELIRNLTREANQARQAAITQEITEIVGGAAALSESA